MKNLLFTFVNFDEFCRELDTNEHRFLVNFSKDQSESSDTFTKHLNIHDNISTFKAFPHLKKLK